VRVGRAVHAAHESNCRAAEDAENGGFGVREPRIDAGNAKNSLFPEPLSASLREAPADVIRRPSVPQDQGLRSKVKGRRSRGEGRNQACIGAGGPCNGSGSVWVYRGQAGDRYVLGVFSLAAATRRAVE